MKTIDKDGVLLCELQARTFELSVSQCDTSSEIFIRRFMNSRIAKMMDEGGFLETNLQPKDLLDLIEEEYGYSKYGTVKYAKNEMYWIGYLYRFFSYTHKKTSIQVYKIVKPKELRELFLPYHTMDPALAIERILEAKGLLVNEETRLKQQYEIFKRIRQKV